MTLDFLLLLFPIGLTYLLQTLYAAKNDIEDTQACSPGIELNEPADYIPNYLILVDLVATLKGKNEKEGKGRGEILGTSS